MTLPFAAGFWALLNELSWLRIAPWPVPEELAEKMPGLAATTGTVKGGDRTPL